MGLCPNCGKNGFEEKKKDFSCEHCGYKHVAVTVLEEVTIVFCEACGVTYNNRCSQHGHEFLKKADLWKTTKS